MANDDQGDRLQRLTDPATAVRRELANALDCAIEEDLEVLAGITPGTSLSWRKRGVGPPYAMLGNEPLYPRKQLAEFVLRRVRERANRLPPKDTL